MKISKLFHWLYAFLMFLPVLALAPSMFYFAFNQESQNYTDVQVNETYEYETNEVNSVDDLVVGNIYKAQIDLNTLNTNTVLVRTKNLFNIVNDNNTSVARYSSQELFNFHFDAPNLRYIIYISGQYEILMYNVNKEVKTFYFVFETTNSLYNGLNISASDYLGEKNVEVVRSEQSPMNIFYTAVNYVYDMPVFSWAKNSFLALPITYVTGLFGMASTNVVNYYLSYWLAISIVYLVFDLVMYVPLLVHRWIDKGMIE